jgi:hypothetical protein
MDLIYILVVGNVVDILVVGNVVDILVVGNVADYNSFFDIYIFDYIFYDDRFGSYYGTKRNYTNKDYKYNNMESTNCT